MGWFLYIVRCNDNSFYTGITWNLQRRIGEHNSRIKTSLQKSKIPVKLVYWEKYSDRLKAAHREKEIKGWSRMKKDKLVNSLRRTK